MQLVLVGAGHAHLSTFLDLHHFAAKGPPPLVITTHPHYTYSGMGPGVLSGIYKAAQGRIHIQRLVRLRGARFLSGTVEGIDPVRGRLFLADGSKVEYDVVSFNIGSRVPVSSFQPLEGRWIAVKPIDNFPVARERILELLREKPDPQLLVIGGGPAGVEISGNLSRLLAETGVAGRITLVAGSRLLKVFSERVRTLASASLHSRGVDILEGRRVRGLESGRAVLDDGRRIPADYTLIASGVQMSGLFQASGLPVGAKGGLAVNRYLQCVGHPEIFGGGDCIDFTPHPVAKIGVMAYRQNPVLLANLRAAMTGKPLRPFLPPSVYTLMFNLGNDSALYIRGPLSFRNRFAFYLKNRIDRRFMARHQEAEHAL